jgi:signal transduction histidine kinase
MVEKSLMSTAPLPAQREGISNMPRPLFLLVFFLTLAVFGAAIAMMTLHLRSGMRAQIVQQDGEVLRAAALVQETEALDVPLEDPADALPALLNASKVRGVFAVRIFDSTGAFATGFPSKVKPASLTPEDLALLQQGLTSSHYVKDADLGEIFENQSSLGGAPVVQALLPIRRDSNFLGAAEFLLDGQNIAVTFARLDKDLAAHALSLWVAASLAIAPLMLWAYCRLKRANMLLARRSADLLRANHELAMSAKTSALGAVTAHLLHGIKNPLFGLHNFVANRGANESGDTSEWEAAAESAARIQTMINDIVRILNESESVESQYEITLAELGQMLEAKFGPEARKQSKILKIECQARGNLQNHQANLVALILGNLAQNALQAAPLNGEVRVKAREEAGAVSLYVEDNGPGMPEEQLEHLFLPCRSSKAGGTGIGLAISHQLAQKLGAELSLEKTSPQGTVFKLYLPGSLLAQDKESNEPLLLAKA